MESETEIPIQSNVSIVTPTEGETDIAYHITDPILGEPFAVRVSKIGAPPWWADSTKVQKLIAAFQNQANITQACISAGISFRQYEYFNLVHPEFCYIKDRCREVFGLQAKLTFGKGLKKDHWLAHAYLKVKEPENYSEKQSGVALPPGSSVATVTDSAFMDADGKVLMRKQTAELIQHDPDLRDPQ